MKDEAATTPLFGRAKNAADFRERFVSEARATQPYPDVVWDSVAWDITSSDVKKRAHLASRISLVFAEHATGRVSNDLRVSFVKGYGDVVKACIVHRRVNRGVESGTQRVFVRAARYLYAALPLPARHDPTLIALDHFLAAENAIIEREKPSSAYRAATFLEEFGRTLDRHGICRIPIEFRSRVKRPTEHMDRTSSTFEQRVKNLPTSNVLNALAKISNDPDIAMRAFDFLRVRIAELLLVCGFRIGEALTLPKNTLVRELLLDETGEPRRDATTGEPIERIGLRYWPEKGGEPIVKWIPTIANPLVQRAIEDIERICVAARDNALWLEAHPGDANLDVLPDEQVSIRRATELLGLAEKSFRTWMRARNRSRYRIIEGARGQAYIIGSDLRAAVNTDRYERPMLKRDDGRVQMLGESLIVIFLNESSGSRATNRFISMPVTWGQMQEFLCGKPGIPSIFERREYLDDDGNPYRIRTHDFRRLLNMIAQRGGLTQTEIAQWMGRRRTSDNAAYDLRTPTEMAAEMRALVANNEVYGVIADQIRMLPEAERGAFLEARLAMSHTTAHGQCASNVAEAPCATAMSCLGGCRQYMRRKGDAKSRESLLRIERETLIALADAREAMAAGKFNAENWVLAQETTLKNTRAALAIDDDPAVEVGDLRQVSPDGPLIGEPL
ncbi:MAG: hypothetical protein ACREMP_02120 [Candidatus Tyrphobacter sp.]